MKARLESLRRALSLLVIVAISASLITGCALVGNSGMHVAKGEKITLKGTSVLPFQSSSPCHVILMSGGNKVEAEFDLDGKVGLAITVPNRDLTCVITFKGIDGSTIYTLKPKWRASGIVWLVLDVATCVFIPVVGIPATAYDALTLQFRNYNGQVITITKPSVPTTNPSAKKKRATPPTAKTVTPTATSSTNAMYFVCDPQPASPAGAGAGRWIWKPSTNTFKMDWQEVPYPTTTTYVVIPQPPPTTRPGAKAGRWVMPPSVPGTMEWQSTP